MISQQLLASTTILIAINLCQASSEIEIFIESIPQEETYKIYVFDGAENQKGSLSDNARFCESIHGSMVSLRDESHNLMIQNLIDTDVWLGAARKEVCSESKKNNCFKWTDKKEMKFTNWSPNEPDNRLFGECAG